MEGRKKERRNVRMIERKRPRQSVCLDLRCTGSDQRHFSSDLMCTGLDLERTTSDLGCTNLDPQDTGSHQVFTRSDSQFIGLNAGCVGLYLKCISLNLKGISANTSMVRWFRSWVLECISWSGIVVKLLWVS